MTKYNIEGGLDFYSELYGSLEETDCEEVMICLITNEKLVDRHVKMNCGHTFNYDPLYKDLVNHKMKFNNMEGSTGVLGKNEIRCPYCRSKQKGILPYYPELGFKRVEGVNTACIPPPMCSFVWDNKDFDENCPENFVNPKTIKCMHIGNNIINDDAKDVFYCAKHQKAVLSKHAKDLKEHQKQEKLASKLKKKEETALAKAFAKNMPEENAVIASNISIPIEYDPHLCVELLKTGDRKGHQCSYNQVYGQTRCKRHHNLLIKKNL